MRSGSGTTGPEAPDPPRVAWRKQMRESVLDEARVLAARNGWDRVSLSEAAARAEVSRPAVYKEFGSRSGLGEALVRRETTRFLQGIAEALGSPGRATAEAMQDAVEFALTEGARNPLIQGVVLAARRGSDGLLPFLTTRPEPVFGDAEQLIGAWLAERFPEHAPRARDEATDLVVRMTISHIVLPGPEPELTPGRLTRAVLAVLSGG
ncbi:TetR family transcriptional regulator [Streptomyces ovatisporus]|uniref:TetR family transcriptional regulator n=1 Tax=Streptomyces ovatisporus TaxID=1128682 RepID=A0ABV9A7K2_9ACTN